MIFNKERLIASTSQTLAAIQSLYEAKLLSSPYITSEEYYQSHRAYPCA